MDDNEKPFVNIPTEEPTISPDTEPSMYERVTNQIWFGWAVRLIIALILIAIIFFGARWIHDRSKNKVSPAPANTKQLPSAPPTSSKSTNTPNSGAKSGNSNSSTGGSKTNGSASSGKGTGTNQQLSNTGPGDVVAVFLATTFGAAGLHYVVNKRREA